MSQPVSFYEAVGGEEFFTRLVHRFYQGVADDPVLRPVYPAQDLGPAEGHLGLCSCSTGAGRGPTTTCAGIPGSGCGTPGSPSARPSGTPGCTTCGPPWTRPTCPRPSTSSCGTTWSWRRTAWSTSIRRAGALTSG